VYLCICNGISEREVRRAIRDGATTMHQLCSELPIANCCGRCAGAAHELLATAGGDGLNRPETVPDGCAA